MQIVTAADKKYRPLATALQFSAGTHDYDTHIWDLGGLGQGTPFEPQPKDWAELRRWKPRYVLAGRKKFRGNISYIDSDSIIIRPFDYIFEEDFDIGFVAKKKKGQDRIRVKAGMVFLKDVSGVISFLENWIDRIKGGYRDQYELWNYIEQFHPLTQDIYGQIIDVDGVKVKLFPWEEGLLVEMRRPNDIHNAPSWAKILHLSGMGKNKYPEKLNFLDEYYVSDYCK